MRADAVSSSLSRSRLFSRASQQRPTVSLSCVAGWRRLRRLPRVNGFVKARDPGGKPRFGGPVGLCGRQPACDAPTKARTRLARVDDSIQGIRTYIWFSQIATAGHRQNSAGFRSRLHPRAADRRSRTRAMHSRPFLLLFHLILIEAVRQEAFNPSKLRQRLGARNA